ncbi:hypothetical protein [Paenibacillus sp. JDR-2]|uniref:hypothetical protein n=1 Tax=Paenibacillus sp. (strain JDR-2) TaxID=324057 RepID=UPI0001667A96|nr:hypothetical protein [Paenibacillus sp. JDR-2]ACT02340.1 hypothetical protein Pjdr2_3709 [Paenibacillus sp. JDR-2]
MNSKVKITLIIVVLAAGLSVWGLLYYQNKMTPTPDNGQWLSVGSISELQKSKKQIDFVDYEGSMTFQGESVDKSLEAPKGFVVTKDTLVFKKKSDGKREIAAVDELTNGQEIEVWTQLLSDHLVGAYEITILN